MKLRVEVVSNIKELMGEMVVYIIIFVIVNIVMLLLIFMHYNYRLN